MSAAAPAVANYLIDSTHSHAQFKVRHMMIANVRGEFTKVSGTVKYDPSNPTASVVEATIDATTISTREPERDNHLKSSDFLDVVKNPTITFKSKKVTAFSVNSFEVVGDLTIHGIRKEVSLKAEDLTPETKDPWGNMRRGVTATTKISRKDFGLEWNVALEAGGWLVGDTVEITIESELIRKA